MKPLAGDLVSPGRPLCRHSEVLFRLFLPLGSTSYLSFFLLCLSSFVSSFPPVSIFFPLVFLSCLPLTALFFPPVSISFVACFPPVSTSCLYFSLLCLSFLLFSSRIYLLPPVFPSCVSLFPLSLPLFFLRYLLLRLSLHFSCVPYLSYASLTSPISFIHIFSSVISLISHTSLLPLLSPFSSLASL